jgi:hypothetical protein
MSTYTHPRRFSFAHVIRQSWDHLTARIPVPRVSVYAVLMIGALIAFESFNYGTTEFALYDLLGDLRFAGIGWSTILALAFCGMDIAGVVRLFTSGHAPSKSLETWYLLAAWLLAATMNAALTWWAVSLALIGHSGLGNEVLGRETLIGSVPIFVAILVWLLRILIIGSFSMASGRIFAGKQTPAQNRQGAVVPGQAMRDRATSPAPGFQPAPKSHVRNGKPQQRPMAARPNRSA